MVFDFYGIRPSDWLAAAAVIVSVAAVIVSVVLFSKGHVRSKKSEQIRISRDLWDSIRPQYRIIDEWSSKMDASPMELINALDSLKSDLSYFVYLIEKGEIDESFILEYYREQLSDIDDIIVRLIVWDRLGKFRKKHPQVEEIKSLIRKYDSLAGKRYVLITKLQHTKKKLTTIISLSRLNAIIHKIDAKGSSKTDTS